MEFKKPNPKKNSSPPEGLILPLKIEKQIVGVFNGQFVTVRDYNSMSYLYKAGNFGKGSLSKGEPSHFNRKDDIPRIIPQSQFESQINWTGNSSFQFQSQSQSCLEAQKNDFKLSFESIVSLLDSSPSHNKQEMWKSLKEMNKDCEFLNKKKKVNNFELSFLEFKRGDVDYKDKDFINMVNDILQSKKMRNPFTSNSNAEKVIVISTNFNPYWINLSLANVNARLEVLPFFLSENLNLNLEESFFLKSVFGCLNIVDLNLSEMDIPDLWVKFNKVNKNFTEKYLTYHYYRSKGWVVRSGLKYGGDYLLYKDGPAYYHASYLVKVLNRRKKLTWREFLSMNRLVGTFNKDLILSNVVPAKTSNEESFLDVLKNHSVQEVLVKRWFPSKERFTKHDESLS